MNVGPVIKEYLDLHGTKQIFVANKCGWTAQKLSNILTGKSPLTIDDFLVLCESIDAPYELFLGGHKGDAAVNPALIKTCDLVAELTGREGVEKYTAEPYQDVTVSANGPAIVLVVTD